MIHVEENKKNPTISEGKKVDARNHFLIKYKTEEERVRMSEKIIKLVQYHEIRDFHIEEKIAFQEIKIKYNYHTLLKGSDFSQEDLEREFLKYSSDLN